MTFQKNRVVRPPVGMVDISDIVGTAEIARGLGVHPRRVRHWLARSEEIGCPQPVRDLERGYLYLLSDWKGWFAVWRATRGPETWNRGQGRGTKPG